MPLLKVAPTARSIDPRRHATRGPGADTVHDVYQALLSRRYLTRRFMPLLACIAVALCTAMVLITWSVMGGFLKNLLESGRTQIGDVKISWSSRGFPHYQDLITRLEADDLIDVACPILEAPGVVTLPNGRAQPVEVRGVDPASFARVTNYVDTIHWRPLDTPTPKDKIGADIRLQPLAGFTRLLKWPHLPDQPAVIRALQMTWHDVFEAGRTLTRTDVATGEPKAAVALGIEVSRLNMRNKGFYDVSWPRRALPNGAIVDERIILPINGNLTLTVIPFDDQGRPVDTVSRIMPVANEYKTGIYMLDANTILCRLDALQDMLNMDEAERIIAGGGIEIGPDGEPFEAPARVERDPARVTSVLVRGAPGSNLAEIKRRACTIYAEFAAAHPGEVPPSPTDPLQNTMVATWEELNATLIDAVKNETSMVLFVFSFISLTAVFLVWSIFWSMVNEKTKDIGILRAIGASRAGVAWLWLRFALAIGCVGAAVGLLLSHLIVWNINPIHEWMGEQLGIQIWKAEIYYFVKIPNQVNPVSAAIVALAGLLTAVLGAMVPAIRAARMHPVRALRFE